ncbi:MAG TPA: LysR family transcriptional regulator [Candidatus Baltobacteraceae bacterium]|jgi:LysR family transcriptional activator of glutamate synthase operon
MELRQVRYFMAVARHAHFTHAAEELSLAQPALSQQVAALERELGVRLFDRTNRRVSLTSAGQAFLQRAVRIVADVDAAAEEMSAFAGGLRGRVVLGTNQSLSEYTLPKILGRFHARYPGVEIALREGLAPQMIAGLHDATLDLAIGDMGDATSRALRGMRSEKLYTDELAIAVSVAHPLAARKRIEIAALRDERFIVFKPGSSLTNMLYALARTAGFEPRVAFESADSVTVRALVAEGLGVTLFPRSIAQPAGPAIAMLSLAPKLVRTISLVHRRAPAHGPAAQTFLDYVREQLLR